MPKKSNSKKQKSNNAQNLIKAISIIDYVYAGLLILAAIIMFLGGTFFTSLGMFHYMFPQKVFTGLIGGVIIIASIFLVALAVLYFYLAKAILEYKMWAKVVQLILSILGIFSFPIGTAIGIYVIWVLLINKETKDLFK